MKREDLIAEENTRVALITLTAGEHSPWHHHSLVLENIICVTGRIRLKLESRPASVMLLPGQRHQISPGMVHSLSNPDEAVATYLLVQQGAYDFVQSKA